MRRKKITAEALRDLLERELRDTAADSCLACRVPLPFRFDGAAKQGPNWRIGGLAECSTLCHTILEDVARKLAQRYELR